MNSPVPLTIVNANDGRQQQNLNNTTNTTTATQAAARATPDYAPNFDRLFKDIQQAQHYKIAYYNLLAEMIPPLVQYQPQPSTQVGLIPSSIKRSPLVLPPPHEPTTLTQKLEPPPPPITRGGRQPKADKSVFSGPHFLPEKYSVKPVKVFRQAYFVPPPPPNNTSEEEEEEEQPSRYYVNPHLGRYFHAALQDGSYFESYTNYDPADPVNFRHAYRMQEEESQNNTDLIAAAVKQSNQPPFRQSKNHTRITQPSCSSRKPSQQQQLSQKIAQAPPPRKWHKPIVSITSNNSFATTSDEDDEDEDMDEGEQDQLEQDDNSDSDNDSFVFTPTKNKNKGKGKASAQDMILDTPSLTSPPTPHPQASSSSSQKRKASSGAAAVPQPTESKKRKTNTTLPNKKEAIEEVRKLGKFIKIWKQKDAEVCCICFQDVTTPSNPIVYCDNALCEAIVHKNCYNINKSIGKSEKWYCDRCKPVNGVSLHRPVTCALCPSTSGAFCKLSEPIHGIEWVHMICAQVLISPGGFTYQPKTHDYTMQIRNHIPAQRFTSKCMSCQDNLFSEFGAKVKCHQCTKHFHVTCAQENGYWCPERDAPLACSIHAIRTTTKLSPQRLAVAFERWMVKREVFFEEQYDKSPKMFKVDAWKNILKSRGDDGGVQQQADLYLVDKTYATFFDRIQAIKETPAMTQYNNYLDCLMNEFCRNYTSTLLLNVSGLFLKKNFYHGDVYTFKPSRDAFSMCANSGDEDVFSSASSSATSSRASSESTINKKRKTISTANQNIKSAADSGTTKKLTQPTKSAPSAPLATATNAASPSTTVTTTITTEVKKPLIEETVVIPSPDLICFICNQHEFPQSTWDSFKFEEGYLQRLEKTKSLRKLGHTGTGNYWDPRVFIQCAECRLKVHCGCPSPPIKKYPQKFQSFVCIHCDTKGEELIEKGGDDLNRRRGTTGINYKV